MTAAFVALVFVSMFVAIWIYEKDRNFKMYARTAKEMRHHKRSAEEASERIKEAISGLDVNPGFQPILDMMLRHDRQTVDYCGKAYRRWRDRIPKKLWARYGLSED